MLVIEGTPALVCVPSVKTTPDAATVTAPVNVGEAIGANPAILAPAGIVTVPVNVGDSMPATVE